MTLETTTPLTRQSLQLLPNSLSDSDVRINWRLTKEQFETIQELLGIQRSRYKSEAEMFVFSGPTMETLAYLRSQQIPHSVYIELRWNP